MLNNRCFVVQRYMLANSTYCSILGGKKTVMACDIKFPEGPSICNMRYNWMICPRLLELWNWVLEAPMLMCSVCGAVQFQPPLGLDSKSIFTMVS